jgi:hypothetical protein
VTRPTSQNGVSGGSRALISWDRRQCSTLNFPALLGEEPTRVAAAGQCSFCLVKKGTDLTTLNELTVSYLSSQLQLVLWTEGTKYYSQASHLVRPHEGTRLYADTRIGCQRNNSRTFTKQTEILVVVVPGGCFSSVLLTSPSPFSYPCSYPFYFPSFSSATIRYSPSQLFFLPLLINSFPILHLSLLSFLNQSPHYHSLLNIHHPLTSLMNHYTKPYALQTLTQAHSTTKAEIQPNTHKGHTTCYFPYSFPHLPTSFPNLTSSATFTNFPNFYIYHNNHYSPTQTVITRGISI